MSYGAYRMRSEKKSGMTEPLKKFGYIRKPWSRYFDAATKAHIINEVEVTVATEVCSPIHADRTALKRIPHWSWWLEELLQRLEP